MASKVVRKKNSYECKVVKVNSSQNSIQREELNIETPWILCSNHKILIFPFFYLTAWLIVQCSWVHFWPKSILRPVLGSHRSPLGHQKCSSKFTTAPSLIPLWMEHTVNVVTESQILMSRCWGDRLTRCDDAWPGQVVTCDSPHLHGPGFICLVFACRCQL